MLDTTDNHAPPPVTIAATDDPAKAVTPARIVNPIHLKNQPSVFPAIQILLTPSSYTLYQAFWRA
jgi:hypothetical protein